MEYIDGKKFQDQLNPFVTLKNKLTRKLDRYFTLASDYLVEFEKKVYEGKSKQVDPFIERMIEKELKLVSFLSSQETNKVSRTLRDVGRSFTKIPVHFLSTDFKPHNIIVNKSLVGIDWGMVKYNGFANWMPASFIRTVRKSDRTTLLSRPLENFFIKDYTSKSIFDSELLNLAEIFDIIISSTNSNKNKDYRFFKKRFKNLTNVQI